MDSIQIPDKTYFKIGEVAKLLDLQPYVLRYWETEFDALRPEKTKTGQRAYRRDDIELLLLVKNLLYEEMYTIAGARRQLKLRKKGAIEPLGPEAQQLLVSSHEDLLTEKAAWATERQRLALAAEKHRDEAGRLRIQNETLEDENAQLAAAQLDYESSIGRLREEVTHRRDAVHTLEQRVEEMADSSASQVDHVDLQLQNSQNVERIAVLEGERDEAVSSLQQAMDEVARESARILELQDALEAAQNSAAQVSAERVRMASEMEALEADLASAESELERLESERATLVAQAVDSSAVDALEAQLATALSRIESLQSDRESMVEQRQQHTERQRVHYTTLRRELQSLATLVN